MMPDRRSFLKTTSLAAGALAQTSPTPAQIPVMTSSDPGTLRSQLQRCLGGPWPEGGPLDVRVHSSESTPDFARLKVSYRLDTESYCPAYLLIPRGVTTENPAPGIAVWHQHNGEYPLGKSEPAGLEGNPMHHTGAALAQLGYVVLCPDALCFEERQDPEGRLKGSQYERFEFLRSTVSGRCMAWKNILDMKRAVDLLASRPEVDSNRLGCYGHSMGSTHTWLIGPFEPRLKALVGNCCLPTYAGIHRTKILHCFPNFIPGFYEFGDTPDIAGLTAPRALHLNLGENDSGSPIAEAREGIQTIEKAYARAGASYRFSAFIEPDTGHVLSPKMWQKTKDFFARHLAS